jgi:hypothetical protein
MEGLPNSLPEAIAGGADALDTMLTSGYRPRYAEAS